MNVLGIETSCDETSVAVVADGRKILSCEVSSSLDLHKIYGGVIPEIASRAQLETISAVAQAALRGAKLGLKAIKLICVTAQPGLPGSLLVGNSFAEAVSLAAGIPLVRVDHVLSHLYANFLNGQSIKFPFIALVVSGGHTDLFLVNKFSDIKQLGQTRDDACGEAFDKVAKILGLGYPGGPEIEKAARKGDPRKIKFRCSGTQDPLDFSFSGIKTAVMYYVQKHNIVRARGEAPSRERKSCFSTRQWSNQGTRSKGIMIADIAASFQETVLNALVDKTLAACSMHRIKRIVVGGGVACNGRLREKFFQECRMRAIDCYFPPRNLCTDNAAMVAGFGYVIAKRRRR